ncbi:IS66 family insertion sequence element accessory protein TnpB [Pseudomonas californiensis]|uniref:IS66 family insertion sequence element accessory protein TnpB n=1 Tax=Pseudomonas californiensis TaxID=2829823 RepID=UPI001E4D976B|nr:IS66 family insertion sequence element accessory protein TnpB [Pseudomonas californiensis]
MEQRLPKHVLSSNEAERILNVPDTQTSTGIRDRAMLETLYSTGMRRMELIGLSWSAIDYERGTVIIRKRSMNPHSKRSSDARCCAPDSLRSPFAMMRPDAKVEKVYPYPKPVDFRKSIDGLAALVELDIKVAVFDPVLFVFLNKPRNRVKILYWERNGFCLWLKRLESERFKTSPDVTDEAIVLTVQELEWMLDGFDLWRNRPHQVLTPRFVA